MKVALVSCVSILIVQIVVFDDKRIILCTVENNCCSALFGTTDYTVKSCSQFTHKTVEVVSRLVESSRPTTHSLEVSGFDENSESVFGIPEDCSM